MQAILLATAASLLFVGAASADGPVATAPATGPAAPEPPGQATPMSSIDAVSEDVQPMAMGPCGPEKVKADGSLETTPHGQVDIGFGTNGYRQVAGAVCQPLGQDAAVTLSIGETQGGWGRRP